MSLECRSTLTRPYHTLYNCKLSKQKINKKLQDAEFSDKFGKKETGTVLTDVYGCPLLMQITLNGHG